MNSSSAGGIAWSAVPISDQDGMVSPAGTPEGSDPALNAMGRWVAASTAAWLAGRGESRAQAAPVPAHPRPGTMAGRRGTRAPGLLRGARQQRRGERLPHPGDPALAPGAAAPQPANPDHLGQDEPHRGPVDTPDPHRAPIPAGALRRHAPKAGAQCGSSARWDLCGGPPARAVPTGTRSIDQAAPGPALPAPGSALGDIPARPRRPASSTLLHLEWLRGSAA